MHNLSIFPCSDGSVRIRFFKNKVFDHEQHKTKKERIFTPFFDRDNNYEQCYGYEIDAFFPDEIKKKKEESLRCSISRTRNRILKIALSGDFKYFATFTFDKQYVDRYDYNAVSRVMEDWLHSLPSGTQYIVVPELHKDGAIHFHGLFSDLGGLLYYVGEFRIGSVYHCSTISFGFHSFVPIRHRVRICRYIIKYITKEVVSNTPNRRRYWYSYSTIDVPVDLTVLINKLYFQVFIETHKEKGNFYVQENQQVSCIKYSEVWIPSDFDFDVLSSFFDSCSSG